VVVAGNNGDGWYAVGDSHRQRFNSQRLKVAVEVTEVHAT